MARDYVNKPKARKGAVRRSPVSKGKKKKANKGKLFSLFALLVLIAALGFGLYKLALVKPDGEATQAKVQQEAQRTTEQNPVKTTVDTKGSPDVQESNDDYSFYEILPKSEVIPPLVPEYKSTPKSAKSYSLYVLQAGSFRNEQDADRLRAELILQGLPNVVANKVESSSGAVWYRVRTGPFDSRSKLNKAQDQLVRMNLQPMQIKLKE